MPDTLVRDFQYQSLQPPNSKSFAEARRRAEREEPVFKAWRDLIAATRNKDAANDAAAEAGTAAHQRYPVRPSALTETRHNGVGFCAIALHASDIEQKIKRSRGDAPTVRRLRARLRLAQAYEASCAAIRHEHGVPALYQAAEAAWRVVETAEARLEATQAATLRGVIIKARFALRMSTLEDPESEDQGPRATRSVIRDLVRLSRGKAVSHA